MCSPYKSLVIPIQRGLSLANKLVFVALLLLSVMVNAGPNNNDESSKHQRQPSTQELFEKVNKSVCTIIAIDKFGNTISGSGFILQDSGLLITNAHVLSGTKEAAVKCGDQLVPILSIKGFDPKIDLVLAETAGLVVDGLTLTTGSSVKPGTEI